MKPRRKTTLVVIAAIAGDVAHTLLLLNRIGVENSYPWDLFFLVCGCMLRWYALLHIVRDAQRERMTVNNFGPVTTIDPARAAGAFARQKGGE